MNSIPRRILKITNLVALGLCFMPSTSRAQTAPPVPPPDPPKVIISGDGDSDTIVVECGKESSIGFAASINHEPAVNQETTLGKLSWVWTGSGGTLESNEASASIKFMFPTPGTYTVSAGAKAVYKTTVDTGSGPHDGDNIEISGDPKSYTIKAVQKIWSSGPGIGVSWDFDKKQQAVDEDGHPIFDGRMLSPQNKTSDPPASTRIIVSPGETVPCVVESATDVDKAWLDSNGDGVEQPDEVTYESDEVTYEWSSGGKGSFGPGTTSVHWIAPQEGGRYDLSCEMDDKPTKPGTYEGGDRDDDPPLGASVEVIVATASFNFVKNSVAEGALETGAHQSVFQIKILAGSEPIAGYDVGKPTIVSGGRGPKEGISAKVEMPITVTGSDGIASGLFTSGSRYETTQITLPLGSIAGGKSASISQVWNGMPGGVGEGKEWAYDEYFDYDLPSTVTYRMAVHPEDTWLPIGSHDIKFRNLKFAGWEWDPDGGEDWDGDHIPDGEYSQVVLEREQFPYPEWSVWNPLSTWTNQSEVPSGSYNVSQTVKWDWDHIVDYVGFEVVDHTAFDADGDTDPPDPIDPPSTP